MLLNSLQSSKENERDIDCTLMEVLVEFYQNESHWSMPRQILSIMADKVSFKVVKTWILIFPNTDTIYNIARHHILLYGRGKNGSLASKTWPLPVHM